MDTSTLIAAIHAYKLLLLNPNKVIVYETKKLTFRKNNK